MHYPNVGGHVLREGVDELGVGVDHGGQRSADLQDRALDHGGAGESLEQGDCVGHHTQRQSQLRERRRWVNG